MAVRRHGAYHKWRCRDENEDYIGMQWVQAEKLQYDEGQEEYAGQAWTQQVLQVLQKAHAP